MNTRRFFKLLAGLAAGLILLSLFINPTRDAVRAGDVGISSVTLRLTAVADVTLAADAPDTNFQDPGTMGPFLELDYWHLNGVLTFVRLFLIRFDLTSLPADATIDSAVLQLHWNGCSLPGTYPLSLGAFFVNSAWEESTVTYNTRPSWATVGLNSQVNCPLDDPTTWYITSFAQAWQSDPAHNYGVKVSAPWAAGYDYEVTFDSREYNDARLHPELVVTYHLPATDTPTSTRTNTATRTATSTKTPTRTSTSTRTPTPSFTSTPNGMSSRIYLPLVRR
jgi:hypothetical protein